MRLFHKSQPKSPQEFDRIILIVNPQSSNIQRIKARAHELIKLFPNLTLETVETTVNPAEFRRKFLTRVNSAKGRTLLAIGGGDGTINMVANILILAQPKINLKNVVFLPLWGGNANDLARMLNGLSSQTKLKSIINQGKTVTVYPFKIKMTAPSVKPKIRYAISYASFGAIAYTAKQLAVQGEKTSKNSVQKHIVNESLRAIRALLDAPGYEVEQAGGRKVKTYEQLFSNGPNMAKLTGLPVKLNKKHFYFVRRSDKRPTAIFYIVRLIAGKKLGQIRHEPVRFTINQRTWAQFDGEVAVISKNTKITVGHASRPLYMLSTKLS